MGPHKLVEKLLKKKKLNYKVYSVNLINKSNTYDINLQYTFDNSISFQELDQLSILFNTKKINIERVNGSGGGCDTCGYGADEGYIEIYLKDVPPATIGMV